MISTWKPQSVDSMKKEINNHTSRKHWACCESHSVPFDQNLRSTWTFRIKRNYFTNAIIKFIAIFCTDGRSQELGFICKKRSLVVKRITIITCLTLSIFHKWHSRAVDFDQTHAQVHCDKDMYLHPPEGYKMRSSTRRALELLRKLCVLKQGGCNFYEKLRTE